MPHDPAKLLWDMREAARRIERFASGKSYDNYLADDLLRSAIERQFEIIGEAMTRLAKANLPIASKITDFRKNAGFRNALIHGYDQIDHETAWGIVINKLPILRREVEALLPDNEE
jgi:uncharacterized protein with HEPN domain